MKFEIIGYSGHSYVVLNSIENMEFECVGYYDHLEKELNPYNIKYLGSEGKKTSDHPIFITIGDNTIRKNLSAELQGHATISIIDSSSVISKLAKISSELVYVGKNTIINPLAIIRKGVIINTAAIIEHEVKIGEFSHIGPNAIICGGCEVDKNVFIGAGAIIKQNISIGDNTIIGAGSVVLNDLEKNSIYVGNPAKLLRKI